MPVLVLLSDKTGLTFADIMVIPPIVYPREEAKLIADDQ